MIALRQLPKGTRKTSTRRLLKEADELLALTKVWPSVDNCGLDLISCDIIKKKIADSLPDFNSAISECRDCVLQPYPEL
jgi:hypothetical protein